VALLLEAADVPPFAAAAAACTSSDEEQPPTLRNASGAPPSAEAAREAAKPADSAAAGRRSLRTSTSTTPSELTCAGVRVKVLYREAGGWFGGTCLGSATSVLEAKPYLPLSGKFVYVMDDGDVELFAADTVETMRKRDFITTLEGDSFCLPAEHRLAQLSLGMGANVIIHLPYPSAPSHIACAGLLQYPREVDTRVNVDGAICSVFTLASVDASQPHGDYFSVVAGDGLLFQAADNGVAWQVARIAAGRQPPKAGGSKEGQRRFYLLMWRPKNELAPDSEPSSSARRRKGPKRAGEWEALTFASAQKLLTDRKAEAADVEALHAAVAAGLPGTVKCPKKASQLPKADPQKDNGAKAKDAAQHQLYALAWPPIKPANVDCKQLQLAIDEARRLQVHTQTIAADLKRLVDARMVLGLGAGGESES